ncbi:MAG: TIGR03663 family protein [Chloroflexaceae bacterium]|nr:TIGR03663 family protein [Chloroflexaceae bacterium]
MQQRISLDKPPLAATASDRSRPTCSSTLSAFPSLSSLSLEHGAYILIGVASLLLHLWGLDQRALHHDETLHASYSWNIYRGEGYMHDPLMHGPFLYFFGALMYFLFGDTDMTARLGFALFGTVLTLLPFLVRREMGRPAALLASAYLLISPVFLYVGRMARHDIYSVTFEMLVFIAVVRYASTRRAGWLYLGAAAFGLMYTNQETSYLFLVIMAVPLVGLFLWQVFKPGLGVLAAVGIVVALLIFVLPGEAEMGASHTAVRDPETNLIQVREPGPLFGWRPLETADNGYALRIRNRSDNDGGQGLLVNFGLYLADLWKFFSHPAVLMALALLLMGGGGVVWGIWGNRSGPERQSQWQRVRERGDTVAHTYGSLGQGWRWLIALVIFLGIYAVLFTAFLTNILGVITGTTGSVLYWLAQHEVERGGQPTYYYLVMLLVYEPLLLLGAAVGLGLTGYHGVRLVLRRRGTVGASPSSSPFSSPSSSSSVPGSVPSSGSSHQLLLPLFLCWWCLAAFGIYSWAGEKMPWLTVHVALPMVLLSGWAFQRWLAGVFQRSRMVLLSFSVGIFLTVVGLNFIILTIFDKLTEHAPGVALVLLLVGLLVMVIVILSINWGWPWARGVLALCLLLVGGVSTIRSAQRVTYVLSDVPQEMLIYTQTSPDVHQMVRRLEEISIRRTGGLDMSIIYDNETVWTWYFRNFPNARRSGPQLSSAPGPEVMAVMLLQENLDRHPQNRDYLKGFVLQRFPLRWWFPEDNTYRLHDHWRERDLEHASLLEQLLQAPHANTTMMHLWQFWMFRDPNAGLGSTDFVMAVRPEIADQVSPGFGGSLKPQEK